MDMLHLRFAILSVVVIGCGGSGSDVSNETGGEDAPSNPQSGALTVRHTPNPCDVHVSEKDPEPVSPYMWYYRTDVTNNLTVPLRVVWFEGYHQESGQWVPGNILGRKLTAEEFSAWYTEGDKVIDGVIPPGRTASCDPNWHASNSPRGVPGKWRYKALDPEGRAYYGEAVVESANIKLK
jgi:hypothetical protein